MLSEVDWTRLKVYYAYRLNDENKLANLQNDSCRSTSEIIVSKERAIWLNVSHPR